MWMRGTEGREIPQTLSLNLNWYFEFEFVKNVYFEMRPKLQVKWAPATHMLGIINQSPLRQGPTCAVTLVMEKNVLAWRELISQTLSSISDNISNLPQEDVLKKKGILLWHLIPYLVSFKFPVCPMISMHYFQLGHQAACDRIPS